ncbi:Uncharacterised protein [uncultured archaeon]|nr:Uncharacterised protein [uncultured archaeon]
MRKSISIDRGIANELAEFAEKKHGFKHGSVKTEAEEAIKKHITGAE